MAVDPNKRREMTATNREIYNQYKQEIRKMSLYMKLPPSLAIINAFS